MVLVVGKHRQQRVAAWGVVLWEQELENLGCGKMTLGSSDSNTGSGGERPKPAVRRLYWRTQAAETLLGAGVVVERWGLRNLGRGRGKGRRGRPQAAAAEGLERQQGWSPRGSAGRTQVTWKVVLRELEAGKLNWERGTWASRQHPVLRVGGRTWAAGKVAAT